MKLTPEQIDQLYSFTRQHYVEYYDLQTELVDHLANAIEQQWELNPAISFDAALQIEFKKFGIFGFTGLVEKREEALNRKYRRIVIDHLKDFFKMPKVVGTLLSVIIVFYLLKQFKSLEDLIPIITLSIFVMYFIGLTVLMQKQKKAVKKTGKKWLLHHIIFGYSKASFYSYFLFQLLGHLDQSNYRNWVYCVVSLIFVSLLLLSYIVLFLMPSKAEQYLKETYPEYKISK